ncbi:hypothetical protein JOC37_002198 [Desulfohalotomaculum tongense]|nr:hypothetical protein [Desulforadius tongensis]
MNAHIEAFHSILEDECFTKHQFQPYFEAYKAVTEFIKFYNEGVGKAFTFNVMDKLARIRKGMKRTRKVVKLYEKAS